MILNDFSELAFFSFMKCADLPTPNKSMHGVTAALPGAVD